ncbi:hypothetical protein KPL47_04485 [Clostridium estertheticum]|uniref:hypothetical protein n=1 Tax=Clostridium estertheticum TaxID=238834 RepID=UPI001C0DEB88|nr:hypothetical protein [Clostridium estertheticum]MBU3175618.1 hypothetical protein [Clostridium estertheticum]
MYLCPYDTSWLLARRYNTAHTGISKKEMDLRNVMRSLWEQHSAWTRMTLISIIKDLPDVDFVTNRLLRNPIDFGRALEVFYGYEIASQRNCFSI